MRHRLETALEDLGNRLGISGLALSETGSILIRLDEAEVLVGYLDEVEAVQFYAVVGGMPDEPSPQFLQVLMAANNLGLGTGRAALGYDTEDEAVTLNMRVPASEVDGASLEKLLEDFSNMADTWRANFADLERTERAMRAEDEDDDPGAGDAPWLRA